MQELPEAYCSICGAAGPFPPFFPGASLRECRCPECGSSRRNRDVARVLMAECLSHYPPDSTDPRERGFLSSRLNDLSGLHVYELQAQGALHRILGALPGYVCSEYFRSIAPGEKNAAGVLCQDASRLTFADAVFDVVISQDIMEHMEDPWQGFAEISRILRPGGVHIFTVPLHEGRGTRQRAKLSPCGELHHLLPPVHHKDPLDPEGALVFWDYGDDLPEVLDQRGIAARKALHARFYEPAELCGVDNETDWLACRTACEQGRQVGFFIYNSVVFVARAKKRIA